MLQNAQNTQNQNVSDFISGVAGGSGVVQSGTENHNINIRLFENADFGKVRVLIKNGEPYFVAKDVAEALGYERPKDAVAQHCKYAELLRGGESQPLTDNPYGIKIIPEADVYALIFRSNLPSAEKFRDWVFREVLPSIRRTGSYNLPDFTNPAEAARAWANEYEMRQLAEKQRDEAIRTKAWISDKKTATAMQTASVLTRKVNALENELGRGKLYKQVKAISWLLDYFVASQGMYTAVGKQLSKLSRLHDYPIHKVEHEEYGNVNSYHVDVIDLFLHAVKADESVLYHYRLA